MKTRKLPSNIAVAALALAAVLSLVSLPSAHAQTTFDWLDTAPDGNWRQGAGGARWNPGPLWDQPPFGVLRFNNNHQLAMTNNVTGTYNMHGVIFGSSNTSSRSLSGNTLRLFDFGGTDPFISNDSSATHFINLNLEGDGDAADPLRLNLNSSGGLTFNGTINNQGSFIDVVGGTSSAVTARFNGAISGGGGLFKDNTSTTAILAANNSYAGITNLTAGVLQVGNGASAGTLGSGQLQLNGAGNTTFRISRTDSPVISNAVVLGGTGGNRFVEVNGTDAATLSGQVTSAAREFWKSGTGTLILSNLTNSFNGSVVVQGGTLEFTNVGALGGSGGLFLGAGNSATTLRYSGSSNGTTSKLGAFALQAAGAASTIEVTGAGALTVSSNIGDLSGTQGLTKAGTGTLIFTGANTYAGSTVVNAGTLVVANSAGLGAASGAVSVASSSNATLRFNAGFTVSNNVSFTNTNSASSIQVVTGNNTAFRTGTTGSLRSNLSTGTRPDTGYRFLAGNNTTGEQTVRLAFSDVSAASNDIIRVSEIIGITGMGNASGSAKNSFVLQLNVASLPTQAFLGWLNGSNTWVNAVQGNIGTPGSLAGFYGTSFATFVTNNGGVFNPTTMLGAWGRDTANGNVWAVVNHNSDFSVIPEPATAALLGLGIAFSLARLRRRNA